VAVVRNDVIRRRLYPDRRAALRFQCPPASLRA
jgi:hypothetical protein